ncbi:hypothetical protein [Streptomyces kanamyceticus]|uniref:hypothetical protein n=1 Tax=Streptomyces kanamyceticus TaxID=1967 RepID=UPI0012FF07D5|nr:hypothetical protein [Streptomyces kanamyceticus]
MLGDIGADRRSGDTGRVFELAGGVEAVRLELGDGLVDGGGVVTPADLCALADMVITEA